MSNFSWSMQLTQTLTDLVKIEETSGKRIFPKVVILGIGNELNGDDAAGVETVRWLRARLGSPEEVLLLEGGIAPENFTGVICRFGADVVIFVDCAEMHAPAGEVAWLNLADLDGLSASTHTLPPTVLAHYLCEEIGCQIGVIGIQPESLEFGYPLSSRVQTGVEQIVNEIAGFFSNN